MVGRRTPREKALITSLAARIYAAAEIRLHFTGRYYGGPGAAPW